VRYRVLVFLLHVVCLDLLYLQSCCTNRSTRNHRINNLTLDFSPPASVIGDEMQKEPSMGTGMVSGSDPRGPEIETVDDSCGAASLLPTVAVSPIIDGRDSLATQTI
jgi:hypothetical protein